MPSAVAFDWIAAHRAQDRVDRRARERLRELADEERALVGLVDEPEQRERRGRAAARTRGARSTRSSRPGACRGRRRTCSRLASRAAVCSARMDAAQAIADLTEISPQVAARRGHRRRRLVVGSNRRPRRPPSASPSGATRLVEEARDAAARTSPSSRRRRSTAASSSSATASGMIAATTTPEPTVGLVFYDLKTCLRSVDEPKKPAPRKRAREEDDRRCRRVSSSPGCCSPRARSPARCSCAGAPRGKRERVDLYAEDGSMHSFADGSPEARAPAADRARAPAPRERATSSAARCARRPTSRATSCSARAAARSTTSTSTASRRGPTCSARSARRSPRPSPSTSPTAVRLAGPELGAVRARRRGLARGRAAVPDRPQGGEGLRHRQPARRRLRGGRVRLPRRGRRHLRRRGDRGGRGACARPGLQVANAICVVDREEGGVDELARHAVRLRPLFTASELLEMASKSAWLSRFVRSPLLGFRPRSDSPVPNVGGFSVDEAGVHPEGRPEERALRA